MRDGTTCIGDDYAALIRHPAIEVVIDATGDPHAGITHCLEAIDNGKHMVMVNVEANALPLGLATGVRLKRDISSGGRLSWDDVDIDETSQAVRVRREMEADFA